MVTYVAMNGPSWLEVGPWQLPLQRLNMTTVRCWPSTAPWKFRVETKNKALCALGKKPGKTGLQIVGYFQVKIFMSSNSCIFSYLEKHQCHKLMSDLVFLVSPTTALLHLLISGPRVFNFNVKFVSPSSSTTRTCPSQHPDSAGTSCLILWTLIALHKCTLGSLGYSPFEI